MNVGGLSSGNVQQLVDYESRNLQNQITLAQRQLQGLASDETMTTEEKREETQEIKEQIRELNEELRQQQEEFRKEQNQNTDTVQMSGSTAKQETAETAQQTGQETDNAETIQAASSEKTAEAVSANSQMTMTRAQSRVATMLENRVSVARTELRQNERNGGNVEAKEAEVEALEQAAQNVFDGQHGSLRTQEQDNDAADQKAEDTELSKKQAQLAAERASVFTQAAVDFSGVNLTI